MIEQELRAQNEAERMARIQLAATLAGYTVCTSVHYGHGVVDLTNPIWHVEVRRVVGELVFAYENSNHRLVWNAVERWLSRVHGDRYTEAKNRWLEVLGS